MFLTLVYLFIYLAALGLDCFQRAFSSFGEQGLLVAVASLVLGHMGSRRWASVVVAHKLSCPEAHGIIPDQGWMEPMSPALAGEFLTIGSPG